MKHILTLGTVAVLALSLTTGCAKKIGNVATALDSMSAAKSGAASNMSASNNAPNAAPEGPTIKSSVLGNYLPDISGYTKGSPEHVDMNMSGMNWSSAKASYTNGDSHVTISILDYSHSVGMAAAYSIYQGLNVETDEEITRSQQISGFPGWVNWKKKTNNGTVGVFVGNRLWVVVETNKASSIDDLVSIAQKVDLAGLAKAS